MKPPKSVNEVLSLGEEALKVQRPEGGHQPHHNRKHHDRQDRTDLYKIEESITSRRVD
jgi:hypothetical protein